MDPDIKTPPDAVPETKTAILFSPAVSAPTRHVYESSRVAPAAVGGGYGIAHFFRCTVTGALRRWGFDAFDADSKTHPPDTTPSGEAH